MNDIEPKQAGDFCPKDHLPVRRVPLVLKSPSVRSYALYCDVCETYWPERSEPAAADSAQVQRE